MARVDEVVVDVAGVNEATGPPPAVPAEALTGVIAKETIVERMREEEAATPEQADVETPRARIRIVKGAVSPRARRREVLVSVPTRIGIAGAVHDRRAVDVGSGVSGEIA